MGGWVGGDWMVVEAVENASVSHDGNACHPDASAARDRLPRGPRGLSERLSPLRLTLLDLLLTSSHHLVSTVPTLFVAMTEAEVCVDCQPDNQQVPAVKVAEPPSAAPHNPLDPTTFVAPSPSIAPSVTIEFCDRVNFHIAKSHD